MSRKIECEILRALAEQQDGTYNRETLAQHLGYGPADLSAPLLYLSWGDTAAPGPRPGDAPLLNQEAQPIHGEASPRMWITDAGRDYLREECPDLA